MDLSKIKAKLEALNSDSSGKSKYADQFWTPPFGKTTIRIVPSAYDATNPFTELQFHTTSGMVKYPVLALSNIGQQDPVEDFIKKLRETSDKDNWSLSGKISPRTRYIVPIIVRGEEDKGVRLWNIGATVYKSLLQLAADDEIGDYTDITTGTDIIVEKTKAEPYPETSVRARRASSVLSEDPELVKKWLSEEHQPKPVDCFRHYSYEDIKKMLEAYLTGKPAEISTSSSTDKEENKESNVVENKQTVSPEPAKQQGGFGLKVETPAPSQEQVATKKSQQNVVKKFDDLFADEQGKIDDLPF